jgi:hypothetical protein
MSRPGLASGPRTSVPRRRWYILGLALLLIAIPAGFVLFIHNQVTGRIREAEAEADRLDPGWRLEELEAARAKIPDSENSALAVIETARLMPPNWLNWTLPAPQGIPLYESLQALSPNQQLKEAQRTKFRAKMQEAARALEYGTRLASMPVGRYPIKWSKDAVGTLLREQQEARKVADLFRYQTLFLAQEGNPAKAIDSVKCVFNTARSLGDEPGSMSCLIRLACDRAAVKALESTLAQGQVDAASLVNLQQMLEEETRQPLQVIAARGDRAVVHQFLKVTEVEGIDRVGYGMATPKLGPYVEDFLDKLKSVQAHPEQLRHATAYVEIAKLHPWEQKDPLHSLDRPQASLPSLLVALGRGGEPEKMARAFHTGLAHLRCATIALALESYRLSEGRWPVDLQELVPKYLGTVPLDPFDGQPLRYVRVQVPSMAGVVVFSKGSDGSYDGGKLERTNEQTTAADICFRLWDVKDRHQPPGK